MAESQPFRMSVEVLGASFVHGFQLQYCETFALDRLWAEQSKLLWLIAYALRHSINDKHHELAILSDFKLNYELHDIDKTSITWSSL